MNKPRRRLRQDGMKHIYTAKSYNRMFGNDRPALKENGQERQTGYVLVDQETNYRAWFPNVGQAKIERDTPGKYGPRGINL